MKKTAENALLQVKDLSVEFNVKKQIPGQFIIPPEKDVAGCGRVSFSINRGEILPWSGKAEAEKRPLPRPS